MLNATDLWGTPAGGCPDGTGVGTCNGNGNDSLDNATEPFRAWQQLSYAGLTPGTFTGVTGPVHFFECDPGINVPASRISGVGYSFNADVYIAPGASAFLFGAYYHNVLEVGTSISNWDTIEPAFTAAEMFNIDSKLDDGFPGTGRIITRPNTSTSGGQPNCTDSDSAHGSTAKYTVTTTGSACGFYALGSW
jgi:hypothetical protein